MGIWGHGSGYPTRAKLPSKFLEHINYAHYTLVAFWRDSGGIGPGERPLGVDEPARPPQRRQEVPGQVRMRAQEDELAGPVGSKRASPASIAGTGLRAPAPAGRSWAWRRSSPSRLTTRRRHDHVHMRVMCHGRAPGVQHRRDADPGAQGGWSRRRWCEWSRPKP